MNIADLLIYSYSNLYTRKGLHPYVFTPFRRIVRLFARIVIPFYFKRTSIKKGEKSDIIVSLTSFPARISTVYLVIQCMLRQSLKPRKIILWLSKSQFKKTILPDNLISLVDNTFEIRFVDDDIRSHKKYYYALNEYPHQKILLVDDDLFYPSDMLEKIYQASKENPDAIICRYGNIMEFDDAGLLLPYNEWFAWWKQFYGYCDDPNFFFGTGGGTLVSTDLLYKDVLNIDVALQLSPLADDVWINAMANLNETKKIKLSAGNVCLETEFVQTQRLTSENVGKNQNDVQICNLIEYYKNKYNINPFKKRFNSII